MKSEGHRSQGLGEGDVDIGIAVGAVAGSPCGTAPSRGSSMGGKTTIIKQCWVYMGILYRIKS